MGSQNQRNKNRKNPYILEMLQDFQNKMLTNHIDGHRMYICNDEKSI